MRTRLLPAALGVLATIAGLGAGHLVASLLDPASSPVLAVGSTVIDLTPTPIKEWAIAQFGTADKPILIGSVFVVTLLLAALGGILARRRFVIGASLLVALVALAGLAAVLRPTAGPLDALPALAAGIVGVLALAWMLRSTDRHAPTHAATRSTGQEGTGRAPASSVSRRAVLVVGVAAAAMGAAGQWITTVKTRIGDVVIPTARDRSSSDFDAAGDFPVGLEEQYGEITPLRTANDDFYRVDTRLTVPTVGVDDWRLVIDGDVENELEFTFEELAAMPLIERDITMTCVSNEVGGRYVGGARWTGVRLTDLLDQAGVGGTADQILSTDVDGFTISTPLEVATDGRDAMIAIGMNGEPLPREHGFPARMITPGIYGFVGATKWVTRLTLTTYADEVAYWTERDWATEAPIKVASRIDTPKPLASLEPGENVIGGVAWAQTRGIERVEVRVDDGQWQQAELGPEVNIDYWRQWYLVWDAPTGPHDLSVRAFSKTGEEQIVERATPFPDGTSGIQQIVVNVS